VGPLGLDRFLDFLPDGRTMAKLVQFTRYLVGQAMAFDVQVFLRASEVPYCRLDDEGVDAPRLGEMAWLKTREFQTDAGDAVFTWVN
jgi:predicted component of type VI protein secretion system